MKTYSMFEAIRLSFFSAEFYRSVAASLRAKALAYLLVILAVLWTPTAIKWTIAFHAGMTSMRSEMVGKFPTVTIDHGELYTPEAKVYPIYFGKEKNPWMVIDTTGQTRSLQDTSAKMLVTKTHVFIQKSSAETNVYDLRKITHFEITQQTIDRLLLQIERWLPILGFPFVFILSVIKRFIEAFCLAILGLIIVTCLKATLDLPALWSLAIVSLTPEMTLYTLLQLSGKHFRFESLVLFLIAAGYFSFAVLSATEAPDDEPL